MKGKRKWKWSMPAARLRLNKRQRKAGRVRLRAVLAAWPRTLVIGLTCMKLVGITKPRFIGSGDDFGVIAIDQVDGER